MLTLRKRMFVKEYLIDLNATQAAIRAGYSPKTAANQGSRLLSFAEIQALIQEENAQRMERTEITADRVLQELARLGFSDPRNYVEEDGSLRSVRALDDDAAAAVQSLEVVEGEGGAQLKKLKLWDKTASLTLLGRHLKLFTDLLETKQEHTVTLETKLREANERVARMRRDASAE